MAQKKPVDSQPLCSERDVKRIDPVWLPGRVPPKFWEDRQHRRDYLLWLGWKCGFRKAADWYRLYSINPYPRGTSNTSFSWPILLLDKIVKDASIRGLSVRLTAGRTKTFPVPGGRAPGSGAANPVSCAA